MLPVLYHMHIPKTAGTTLRTLVKGQFEDEATFPALVWRGVWEEMGLHDRPSVLQRWKNTRNYRFLSGHFGYQADGLFLPRSVRRFTMLRDPADRALSFYHHLVANPSITFVVSDANGRLHELPTPVPDVRSLLEHPVFGQLFNNIQTRYLAVDYDAYAMYERYRDIPHHAPDFSHELIGTSLSANSLARAKKRLAGLTFGLQECMTVSQWLIFDGLSLANVPLSPETVLMRWGDYRPVSELPAEERALLLDHNRFDSQLYAFAQTLFLSRVNSLAEKNGLAGVASLAPLADGSEFADALLRSRS